MIYTIVGDPHAKPDNLDKINQLFDLIEELGNPVIILGDLLDTKEIVRGSCLNTYIRRIQASKLTYRILCGNHDQFRLGTKEHSLEPLKLLSNVKLFDTPAAEESGLAFIPYLHDAAEFKEALSHTAGKTVFCHADIQSFDYGNGLISQEGASPEDFEACRSVISGHYHKYQKRGKITYLGTPFSHSFGESNQKKYIATYDTEKDKLKLIPTPFPSHVTLEIDCAKTKTLEKPENAYVRAILTGTQEQIDRFNRVPGVKYIERPIAALKKSVINETMSTEKQFEVWAKDLKGYTPEVVSLGLEILKNVQKS